MAHLIDKSALVAEIESLKSAAETMLTGKMDLSYWRAQKCLCERFLSFIDTLEAKEVDLEKHLKEDIEDVFFDLNGVAVKGATHYLTVEDVKDIARHFFELGIKAQHSELTWEDISVLRKIMAEYRRQTSNEMLVLNDEDYCKEVLNRFKAQKGEKV